MEYLENIGKTVQEQFKLNRRVLSYDEYLNLVRENPRRHARNAAQYLQDMFDYYGSEMVRHPEGEVRRFKLFDAPWDNGEGRLIGQEEVQNHIYRIVSNFARQRRVDRFTLLHGPNGSSKSTITEMMSRAMEHYSAMDEGVLYRFNWIFPSQRVIHSGIGFGTLPEAKPAGTNKSYAYLEDEWVDARLLCEMHDHPLLLIPQRMRAQLLEEMLGHNPAEEDGNGFLIADYLLKGDLCQKCKLVYEALLNSYHGDYLRVLQHVQVERFYVSRRYRQASTRVEPQLAVDAKARQVTADRSLAALPTALQSISLFELDGDLVQANRGVIDYPDLLKRPIEAFKYLLTTVEDGRVVLDETNLFFDLIFLGSTNETHLNHFMESPDWMSFKGRFELVRVPYLLDYNQERKIYDSQINPLQVGKHIAPHATAVAALWAVLTRMHKPEIERYDDALRKVVAKLSPLDKVELYAHGQIPTSIRGEEAKLLRVSIGQIYSESDAALAYEGRTGASPREIKTIIMNAAQNSKYGCLTPLAVLDEIRQLVQETSIYPFLRMEPKENYYNHKQFIEVVENWYLDKADGDVRSAMGLVEETSYSELFSRYITHITHLVRKEKLRNPITGTPEDPDEKFMQEVERAIGAEGNMKDFRQGLITKVGAWSVDHSGEKPDYRVIFSEHFERMRTTYFEQHSRRITRILRDALHLMSDGESGLSKEHVRQAQQMLTGLKEQFYYCEHCSREAITLLVRKRYK